MIPCGPRPPFLRRRGAMLRFGPCDALHVCVMETEFGDGSIAVDEAVCLIDVCHGDVPISVDHVISVHLGDDDVEEFLYRLRLAVQAEVVDPDFKVNAILGAVFLGNPLVGIDGAPEGVG